jgi:crotonobetainyl-CoA:carnitine CoA-transferase CaiB-like acyl-CoA transferase
MKVGVAVVDVLAGYAAATAILAAKLSGEGKHIEISLLDVALSALVNVAQSALVTGAEPGRHGNAHESIVPYQTFAASDATVAVACGNDSLYRRLCDAVGRPDLAADERFLTNPRRVAHREELVGELSTLFATQPADEWVARLSAAGVPAGKVRGVLEALTERGTATVEHPTIGSLPLVPSSFGLATEPPPLLGGHTREVLAETGYADEEVAALEASGVIATS